MNNKHDRDKDERLVDGSCSLGIIKGVMSGNLGWIGGLRGVTHLLRMTMESGKRVYNAFSYARKPITVIVEGNIGSGKTTFLRHFQKLPDFTVVDEPIDKWRDCHGHNLLELMYKDPKKWSLCFQSYVQLTMLDLHVKPVVKPVKMMERSIFSAKNVFVRNLKDQGLMNEAEYAVLSEWFDFIQETIPLQVDLIVYLKTDPEVVFERIANRGRNEENSITLTYLKNIHKLHEDWLLHKKFGPVPPVLTIDANEDLSKMMMSYSMCEETIIQKVAIANV